MLIFYSTKSKFKVDFSQLNNEQDYSLLAEVRGNTLNSFSLKDPINGFDLCEKIEDLREEFKNGVSLEVFLNHTDEIWKVLDSQGVVLKVNENVFNKNDKIHITEKRRAIL